VWSVVAVNGDTEQEVDVRAQALATSGVVGELVTTWKVGHPGGSCYVYFNLSARPS
jgi:hypothetical protein